MVSSSHNTATFCSRFDTHFDALQAVPITDIASHSSTDWSVGRPQRKNTAAHFSSNGLATTCKSLVVGFPLS